MASIVSAGTTSATALNMSADTTGVLSLASNNGVVALIIDASQNIGINSASSTIRTKLMASSSNANDAYTLGTVSGAFSVTNSNTNYGLQFGSFSTGNSWIQSARMDGTATGYNLILQPGGGSVGIGESSPTTTLDVKAAQGRIKLTSSTGTNNTLVLFSNTGGTAYVGLDNSGGSLTSVYALNIYHEGAYPITFSTNNAEKARIDSSGNFCLGQTTANGKLSVKGANVDWNINSDIAGGAATKLHIRFIGDSVVGGTITSNGATASYNTTSDYRLKENIAPMTGALAKVIALKPCTYKWKPNGFDGQGFIAHELAGVVPECVTGEKDAVQTVEIKDADGNVTGTEERPVYQGIDTSFLVATLTAAIQELNAKVTDLEEQVLNLGVK